MARTETDSTSSPLLEREGKAVRLHHLIKAPENTQWALEKKHSWDAKQPASVYVTPEMLPDGSHCSAATIILRTKGCHWWWSSGCTFCGYFNDTRDDVTSADLHAQWQAAKNQLEQFADQAMVKVYTSGSLLEDREIPVDFQQTVLSDCHLLDKHLILESRTEQITVEKLVWAKQFNPQFTVAIGLEAYDDEVLKFHVNKGFSVASWHRAVENLRAEGLGVKTYLMFKPPFMSEGEALEQCVEWIASTAEHSDEISVNPMNIQRGTVIDRMYRSGDYRPPWLWSLVEMIARVNPLLDSNSARLIVHPTAAGKARGAHNCGNCDTEVAAAIERYSVSGDLDEFAGLDCNCRIRWSTEVELDISLPAPLGVGMSRRRAVHDIFYSR